MQVAVRVVDRRRKNGSSEIDGDGVGGRESLAWLKWEREVAVREP
jgi:hypothetical protein